MPLENDLDKVLIIVSGPTLVGSFAEMDLMAVDAIKALIEEGIQVVLVNPNPATVSTDKQDGVTVYLEPMTLDFLKRILRMEEPDAIITAYGSTTALKVAQKLLQDGILQQMKIRMLTLNPKMLMMQNQQKRLDFLTKLDIDVSMSWHLKNVSQSNLNENINKLKESVSFPVLVTKHNKYIHNEHFTFKNIEELTNYFKKESQDENFSWTHYSLSEDLSTWEEIIINLIRDSNGNIVFINYAGAIEPISINYGDSSVIMPVITLNNDQIQYLRAISRKIAENLNLLGVLSIHFAVQHHGTQIKTKVLTIKPRLTRSSVWIQKLGTYSVGYILAKVAIGYNLNEITDPRSDLNATIEPVLDTISIKMPYWSLTESGYNHYQLNNRMQASGEAIGIGRNFETAFIKGLASTTNLNLCWQTFNSDYARSEEELIKRLAHPDENHLITLLAALAKGMTYADLQKTIHIHPIYFQKLKHLIKIGKELHNTDELSVHLFLKAKKYGFTNELIALIRGISVNKVFKFAQDANLTPSYIQIDGSAGIYQPKVQSFYSAYNVQDEAKPLKSDKKILIIGMLPLQVSVTSEFDYMIAHVIKTLHKNGYETVLLSNNAESVAANYENLDRIYFDPITIENILSIANKENIKDILLQFSGKKVSALSKQLIDHGLNIIGSEAPRLKENINNLLLNPLHGLKSVPALNTKDRQKLFKFVSKHDFPVLIGGFNKDIKQKSAIVYDVPAIEKYLKENRLDQITVSRFIEGNKYEVTAISDGTQVTIPGIIEHLEQTGSHASDSISVYKPQNLNKEGQNDLAKYSIELIKRLQTRGIFSLHFLKVDSKVFLLQIKPYAGHNVAFLSKSVDKDITSIATEVLIGKSLKELGFKEELWSSNDLIHVKMPVFSYIDYKSENTFDSKMKSSGSVMGRDTELSKALYKGYEASDLPIPSFGTIFISVRDEDKEEATKLAKRFNKLGFKLIATEGTANMIAESGITTGVVSKIHEAPHNLIEKLHQHKIVMVVNITNLSDTASADAIIIRDQALNTHIPVFSSIETTELILDVLEALALTTQPI